jgi:predicted RNA-binding protein associated with RNAse of E/G family
MDIILKNNNRFVEISYKDRWYNIFKVHDRDDDLVKDWY